jgi:exonuclease VII large subunit
MKKTIVVIAFVLVVAVVAYAVFPILASTNVSSLKVGEDSYVYATVQSRTSFLGFSGFTVNQSSSQVFVLWNGTLPAVGEKVLVHGEVKGVQSSGFSAIYISATSVYDWPF